MQSDWTLSVSQLNEYVRKSLAGDPMLQNIRVSGELSGVKRHFSGHIYFTLKDESARVQCVMFRSAATGLAFLPEDGMRVVVRGSASLYTAAGAFQIYADAIERQGVGELYLRFEALKRRLSEEGLFDPAIKRELPALPRTIGVVTSRAGAVLHDIVRVARRRDPNVRILLAPAAVQGAGAAEDIARAIALLNRQGEADVILCGRGGGSLEDLWPFNEEIVARAIRSSRIPVVSCVGHETDFTIADFAADLRAPTPSAAA
ncbi:MAG: exodeoxyribonuclease VII large subunit, partial [Clostridia bacterium]|nr:exodeoxyribonuclease VII large subunit [Clostridia bacterium]